VILDSQASFPNLDLSLTFLPRMFTTFLMLSPKNLLTYDNIGALPETFEGGFFAPGLIWLLFPLGFQ